MRSDKINEDQPGIQPYPVEKSGSINTNKSKPESFLCDEQSDYAAMNENAAKINNVNNTNKCCKKCKKPKCCNCCMCSYICLLILFLFGILIIIIIYGIEAALKNVTPEIKNVYIQLFDYGIGEDQWKFGNVSFAKIFMNATGAFRVEAYNPNFAGFYMHHWRLDAISLNLYQNPEEWGNVYCCANHPKWNHSNPFIRGNETFIFDQQQWFGSHDTMNMTFVLFVDHLSEELFYVGWEASWINDWRLPLSLHGTGWGKSDTLSMDIKILMDCDITVNASYFFPFDPPTPPLFIQQTVDITNNGDYHVYDNRNNQYSSYLKEEMVGRVPPKKYEWQQFPVLNVSCSFGVGDFKFL